jgi:hypothetical protein
MITAKATKENALSLVKFHFGNVLDEKYKPFKDEFYCFEQIAKGHAMLDVCRDKRFNENQKKEMYKLIMEL